MWGMDPLILRNQIWTPAIKLLKAFLSPLTFAALGKECIHYKLMTISKVIMIRAASCISDKLQIVNTMRTEFDNSDRNIRCHLHLLIKGGVK